MSAPVIRENLAVLLANVREQEEEMREEVVRQRLVGTTDSIQLAQRKWLIATGVTNEVEAAVRAAQELT